MVLVFTLESRYRQNSTSPREIPHLQDYRSMDKRESSQILWNPRGSRLRKQRCFVSISHDNRVTGRSSSCGIIKARFLYRLFCIIIFSCQLLPSPIHAQQNPRRGISDRDGSVWILGDQASYLTRLRTVDHNRDGLEPNASPLATEAYWCIGCFSSFGLANLTHNNPELGNITYTVRLNRPSLMLDLSTGLKQQCIQIITSTFTREQCSLPPYCGTISTLQLSNAWFTKVTLCIGYSERPISSDDPTHLMGDWVLAHTFTDFTIREDTITQAPLLSQYYILQDIRGHYALIHNTVANKYVRASINDNDIVMHIPDVYETPDGRYCLPKYVTHGNDNLEIKFYDSIHTLFSRSMFPLKGLEFAMISQQQADFPERRGYLFQNDTVLFVVYTDQGMHLTTRYIKPEQLLCMGSYQTMSITSSFISTLGHAVIICINSLFHYIFIALLTIEDTIIRANRFYHLFEFVALVGFLIYYKYELQSAVVLSTIAFYIIGYRRTNVTIYD